MISKHDDQQRPNQNSWNPIYLSLIVRQPYLSQHSTTQERVRTPTQNKPQMLSQATTTHRTASKLTTKIPLAVKTSRSMACYSSKVSTRQSSSSRRLRQSTAMPTLCKTTAISRSALSMKMPIVCTQKKTCQCRARLTSQKLQVFSKHVRSLAWNHQLCFRLWLVRCESMRIEKNRKKMFVAGCPSNRVKRVSERLTMCFTIRSSWITCQSLSSITITLKLATATHSSKRRLSRNIWPLMAYYQLGVPPHKATNKSNLAWYSSKTRQTSNWISSSPKSTVEWTASKTTQIVAKMAALTAFCF